MTEEVDGHGEPRVLTHDLGLQVGLLRDLRDGLARHVALATLSLVRRVAHAPAGIYTLCYHHIAAHSRSSFARQLDYLGRHGRFVSADEALALMRSGGATADRFFLVSFDDGYADQYDVALPLLRERGISAIAFIVTAWLTDPTREAKERAGGHMTARDLERWVGAGMQVGSHSHTHRQLITLSADELADEFGRSSAILAEIVGEAPVHFACPWGVPGRDFVPERAARLAQEAGYATLFTTTRGFATAAGQAWQMPRHVMEPEWPLREIDALVGNSVLARNAFAGRRHGDEGPCRSSS